MKLRGLRYYGGKNPLGQVGPWVASNLPHTWRQTYIEPFAGMLGVLLCRAPCKIEVANDLDGDVANWWRQVRDNADELTRKIEYTPLSRQAFDESLALLEGDGGSALDRAVAFQCVVTQSVNSSARLATWAPRFSVQAGTTPRDTWRHTRALAERLWNVQLECRPVEEILDRVKSLDQAVVYCDPPYAGANTTPYVHKGSYDQALTAELLLAQRGFAAVSGYEADGWDGLLPGWKRFDKVVAFRGFGKGTSVMSGEEKRRVESLWVNKPPTGTQGLFA